MYLKQFLSSVFPMFLEVLQDVLYDKHNFLKILNL